MAQIKITWKSVQVFEHEAVVNVSDEDFKLIRLWGNANCYLPERLNEAMAEQTTYDRDIALHHSHYGKLMASAYKGWFDVKVTRRAKPNPYLPAAYDLTLPLDSSKPIP